MVLAKDRQQQTEHGECRHHLASPAHGIIPVVEYLYPLADSTGPKKHTEKRGLL
jgi:hypothetical protein